MRTSTFTCDVCKATCTSMPEADYRPNEPAWLQVTMAPFHPDNHTDKVPYVTRDVCSTACAVKLLKGWQTKLEELRREATK